MPSATPALKRQNHRIHPCNSARKNDLLNHLIQQYAGKSILIVTSGDTADISAMPDNNVTLTSDALLAQSPELKCDVLISYDLPDKAIIYMSRFARAQEYALILLSAEDQKLLYPVETLLGRTVTQEIISGFEPDFGIAVEQKSKEEAKARREEREARAQTGAQERPRTPRRDDRRRDDSRSDFKREERDTRPAKKPFSEGKKSDSFEKKDSKPRFVGKDENGKPIFEGKTRERNHYIDGTPRSNAEKAARTPYASKPKFFGNKDSDKPRSSDGEKAPYSGEKKPYEKKPYGDKKPFDKDKKPYDGKKSFGDRDKKPYGDKKPFDKDKKPYDGKKSFGEKDKKPYDKSGKSTNSPSGYAKAAPTEAAAPKRPPRRINVKSLNPSEDKK